MSAVCHSRAGFYSVKSPLHTHWALLSTLHFKNLGSFRGNKDSGIFFPSIVMSICFPHRMHWSTLKIHMQLSRHGAIQRQKECGSADPGLELKEVLSSTGLWAHPPGILFWLTQPCQVNGSSWGYREGKNNWWKTPNDDIVLNLSCYASLCLPQLFSPGLQGLLLAESISPQCPRWSQLNRKYLVFQPLVLTLLALPLCAFPNTHILQSSREADLEV